MTLGITPRNYAEIRQKPKKNSVSQKLKYQGSFTKSL